MLLDENCCLPKNIFILIIHIETYQFFLIFVSFDFGLLRKIANSYAVLKFNKFFENMLFNFQVDKYDVVNETEKYGI